MNIAPDQNVKVLEEAVAGFYSDTVKITPKSPQTFRITFPLLRVRGKPTLPTTLCKCKGGFYL